MIVMKFGGTSVADTDRIRACAAIVRDRKERDPVVVVSALGGVTDLLERAIGLAQSDDLKALDPILADLERRHRWALNGSVEDAGARHQLNLELDRTFEHLRMRLRSMRILGEGTPRTIDAILACGETLSSQIIAAAFRDCGVAACCVESQQVLRTDARFGQAEPDLDRTREDGAAPLRQALQRGETPIVGGFVGAEPNGETTTLGRGGSDTTAAVLGLVLEAEEIQIWTDVDGIMTADPRVVADAVPVSQLTFGEAAELALFGAKVLHPSSVAPAVVRQIPVRVLNSMRAEREGTLIVGARDELDGWPIASIASLRDLVRVTVLRRGMRAASGLTADIEAALAAQGMAPVLSLCSEVSVTAAVRGPVDAPALERALAQAGEALEVEIAEERALIGIVGAGIADAAVRRRALEALAGQAPELVSVGASRTSIAGSGSGAPSRLGVADVAPALLLQA